MAWSPKAGYKKVTIPMALRQIATLDRIAVDMRLNHGIVISRSQIIRALIDLHETKNTPRRKR